MKDLKFDPARFAAGEMPTLTRGGLPVRIISTDGPSKYQIIGIIGNEDVPSCWTKDGRYFVQLHENENDLVHAPKVEKVRTIWYRMIGCKGIRAGAISESHAITLSNNTYEILRDEIVEVELP